jgi:hypothetical protein
MVADRYMATTEGANNPTDAQSWNRYVYAGGDPVNHNDPTGQDFCDDNNLFCFAIDFTDSDGSPFGSNLSAYFSALAAQIEAAIEAALKAAQEAPARQCSISLWERPVPTANGPGWHTYISVFDSSSPTPVADFEAGPVPGWNFVNGTLTGVIAPPGQGLAGAPSSAGGDATGPGLPNNYEVGTIYSGPNACQDIDELDAWVANYNDGPKVKYNFAAGLGGYNSNSFTYTLVSQLGLLNYFGTPGGPKPGGGFLLLPGWNMLVPRL